MPGAAPLWRIGVDVGGTFADCMGVAPDGEVRKLKLLSDGRRRAACVAVPGDPCAVVALGLPGWCVPALVGARATGPDGETTQVLSAGVGAGGAGAGAGVGAGVGAGAGVQLRLAAPLPAGSWLDLHSAEEAPVWGARLLTGTPPAAPLPALVLQLSTTRGTNALLEGGPKDVALVVNEGLEGVLAIGTQQRLGIFDLAPRKPPQLARLTVGVSARMNAEGHELHAVDPANIAVCVQALRESGARHVAVALLHSWRNRAHEDSVAALLRAAGFESVCTSAELAAVPRLVPRAQTAVVEARLFAPVRSYLARVTGGLAGGLEVGLAGGALRVGTSAGGVVPASIFRAKDSLLSGPAAGCAGAAAAMRAAGVARAVTFDMGGTSTDVSRLDEHGVGLRFETTVAGSVVATPSIDVHSVAAGGGSVCVATAQGLFVGPQSAGSHPGPACYGRGGPLALTDVNLLLGRLWAERSTLPLDRAAAERAALAQAQSSGRDLHTMLAGFLEVAHEHMAAAVRTVSTSNGHDPRDHTLLAFGGAGGQHACAVAQRLGMTRVLVVKDAGFVSARGVLGAALERTAQVPLLAPLGDGVALHAALARARAQAESQLRADGAAEVRVARAVVVLRAAGRSGAATVDVEPAASAARIAASARAQFRQRMTALGDPAATEEPQVDSVQVVAREVVAEEAANAGAASFAQRVRAQAPPAEPAPLAWIDAARAGGDRIPVFAWEALPLGFAIRGPAVIVDDGATAVVDPGWRAQIEPSGGLALVAGSPAESNRATSTPRNEQTDLEVAAARFVGIATWMGTCLERSALSVNVKERLDFSCGVLDPLARLVANAPHIPVHLGALGACVRAMQERIAIGPGDIALTNDPRFGGSHLPDLTVVRAVHGECGTHLGFVAARAHHAEVGGITPGSMPPNARSLAEEGVVIPPLIIGTRGLLDEALLRRTLTAGPWPSRNPDTNIADIRAAVAALDAGADAIRALAAERGAPTTLRAMERLLERSAEHIRRLARNLAAAGPRHAAARLDDGTAFAVTLTPSADGTMAIAVDAPGIHPRCFNAPLSVTRSAILYVLRVLAGSTADPPLDDHVAPLNEGFLTPVSIRVTPGFLNPFADAAGPDADPCTLPPVFAGNTECSQRLVDTLLLALGAAACSQGTMNNLVFGNTQFSVYETIGGGAGACAGSPGVDSVHVHMSNTRLTDPETLELRHPVRLERLQVRAGSGGAGAWHGGCGTLRRIRMLAPVQVSFIGQHRVEPTAGLAGGQPGALGEQRILRADGTVEPMLGVFTAELASGDAVEICTPGGGGYGT